MNDHARSIRVGAAAVCCAALFRLLGSGFSLPPLSSAGKAQPPSVASHFETGQNVRFSPSLEVDFTYPAESSGPEFSTALPVFPDASPLRILDSASAAPDAQALLTRPLTWDLTREDPAVLILSTHSTESYTKNGEDYAETSSWRTLDKNYNMLSIGAQVASLLEEAGIRVIRDETLHDYPSYNGSYAHARASIRELLAKHPSVKLILDLHRDASDASGPQLRTAVETPEGTSARMMLVIGAGHDRWQENLSLALKLMAQLETQAPGITRPLLLGKSTFNQDLCPGALLIEMGAAGNSRQEAKLAAEYLAQAIIALAKGTADAETADS